MLETQGEHIRELPGNVASIITRDWVSGRKICVFQGERLKGKPGCLLWGKSEDVRGSGELTRESKRGLTRKLSKPGSAGFYRDL